MATPHIDRDADYIISGYIREYQACIETSYPLFKIIPNIIISACKLYSRQNDYFEIIGNNTTDSENYKYITKTAKGWHNTSYGSNIIPSTSRIICKWWLKIGHTNENTFYAHIGLSAADEKKLKNPINCSNFALRDGLCYAFWNCAPAELSYKHRTFISGEFSSEGKRYGKTIKNDDIFCIELNLDDGLLRFYINDVDQGVAFDNVEIDEDVQYRLAVSMCHADNTVEIVDYEEKYF